MRGGTGRTRTTHQSAMERGRVRPAHLVEHHHGEVVGGCLNRSGRPMSSERRSWSGGKKAAIVRGTPGTSRRNGNRRFPFCRIPSIAALFELECLVSDKVSW